MRLTVEFPLDNDFVEKSDKVRKTAKKFHGSEQGSGAGLGMRDISFEFKKEKDLEAAEVAIKALNIKGLRTTEY